MFHNGFLTHLPHRCAMQLAHDLPLLSTIALSFTAAFVCGLIAAKMRLSPIVGYLIAGILIGPYTPGLEADVKIAEQLSEIGILLLMFGVGLHFSVRDLLSVWHIAVPGALVRILLATGMGWGLASCWGWSTASGLMLGLALSVASTVVLLRAMEEHHLTQTTNGYIAIGWLIVEDIVMVLALVMIPTLAALKQDASTVDVLGDLGIAVGKVALFILFMTVVGRRALPWLLMTVARLRSRELFTLAVFAVAIGVAFGAATLFGVSFALGAFFAGMMIRESDLSHEAAEKALPLQDAFAVLFFVSVGMLFDPAVLLESPWRVLAVVAVILLGRALISLLIVLCYRYPLKTALVVSAGLSQIGEFSFILVGLGVSLSLLPVEGRHLILAGAIISISLNPACFHASRLIYDWAAKRFRNSPLLVFGEDDLAHLSQEERAQLRELVILVGHGRVGQHISENLKEAHLELVVVDANRERVEALRDQGFHAIAGDATHEETLFEAAIANATAIIVAVPNPYEARRIVETARLLKPGIRVLVRAHNDAEMQYFAKQKVDLAVMGPREVGRRMVEFLQA